MAPSVCWRKGLRVLSVMVVAQLMGTVISAGKFLFLGRGFLKFQVCTPASFCSNFLVQLQKVIKGMVKVYLVFSCPVLHPGRQKPRIACAWLQAGRQENV